MKLTFLGTAAAEGFPAVFCRCEYCNEARRLGGKNIRSRSQALVNDDLLIDFPADTYWHFMQNGIEGDKIKYLLVTHSHSDHLYPSELGMRNGAFAHDMRAPELKVFCSDGAYNKITGFIPEPKGFSVTKVTPFETFSIGDYEVTPLPARHFAGDGAVFYIIKGEKTLLYGHDTGYFYDEVLEYLEKQEIRFDLVTLDCTFGTHETPDTNSHMGIENIRRLVARLRELGAVDDRTTVYINHFSHNVNPIQQLLEEEVKADGFKVSFDGDCVVF